MREYWSKIVWTIFLVFSVGCAHRDEEIVAYPLEKDRAEWLKEIRAKQEPLLRELELLGDRANKITFYTINPGVFVNPEKQNESALPQLPMFHDWQVLGSVDVQALGEKAALLNQLVLAARATDGDVAMCFEPRHALRIISGRQTIDIVICFHCREALVFGAKKGVGFRIAPVSEDFFNGFARRNGLQVAN